MRPYRITYTEGTDGETQTVTFRGYDAAHAEERFWDDLNAFWGPEGVRVLSVTKIRTAKKHA